MNADKPRPRRRLDAEARRGELLEAARSLFVERAYDEVSLDDIAARAGASKALLLHYFGDKRRLYVTTLRDACADLIRATTPDPSWPPETRMRRGLDAYLGYAERAGPGYVALLRGGVGVDREVFEIVEATRRKIVDRALGELGVHHPSPLLKLTVRAWIGFVEAASVEWLEKRRVKRERLLKLLVHAGQALLAAAVAEG